jgi:TP901 family phage tail tape measure protein
VSERLGAAFVEVLADTSEFARSLEAGVGDAMRGIGDKVGESLGDATDKVRRSLRETLDEVGTSLQTTGKRVESVGSDLNRKVTLPIIAIGTAAVASFTTVDKGLSEIGKATGATGADLAGLGDVFQNVLRNVPEPAAAVAAAIGDLNTRLGVTGEELEQLTRESLDFARVNNVDVAQATTVVGKLLNALELEAGDASLVMDKLTLAAQQTGISATGLAQNILDAGPAFEELGFGLDRSIALFASFEAAGARPEEVIGSLNLAINKMAKEAGKLDELERGLIQPAELFDELLESIKDAPDILAATTVASEVFGARVGAKVAEDIRAGRFEVDDFAAAIANAGGTVDQTARETETFTDRMAIAKNELLLLGASFGEILAPMIEKAVGAIRDLLKRFEDLSPRQRELIVRFALIAAAVGPVILIIGKLITATGTILKAVGGTIKILGLVGKAFLLLGKIILANPLFLLAALLIAVAVVIFKFREEILEALVGAWTFLKEKTQEFWEWLKATVTAGVDAVVGFITGLRDKAVDLVRRIWEFYRDTWTRIFDFVRGIAQRVRDFVGNALNEMRSRAVSAVQRLFDGAVEIFNRLLDFVRDLPARIVRGLGNLADLLKGAGRAVIQGLWDGMRAMWSNVTGWISGLGDTIRNLKGPLSADRVMLEDIGEAIIGGLGRGMEQQWRDVSRQLAGLNAEIPMTISPDSLMAGGLGVASAAIGSRAGGGRQEINLVVNNPAPEPASTSLNRELRKLSAIGVFGDD